MHRDRKRPLVLAAKLAPPRQGKIYPRPRLFRRLDRALRGDAIWVTGPPGAGKTALVASWIARRRRRPLWLQLDAGDGDPAELFRWLTAAAPARWRKKLPRFGPEYLVDPAGFGRRFARALRGAAGRGALVVLDDYGEIPPEAPSHATIRELVAELAGAVGVVVASRVPPPPQLSGIRARGGLEILGADALALTAREAAMVARSRGAGLPSGEELVALTGGWAAGVVLLAATGPLSETARPPLEVYQFLATEVFERTPPAVQEVLLALAFLPRVGASSSIRLARDPHAPEILDDLAASGWFVQRQPGPEAKFQLHGLLREFLSERARRLLTAEALRERLLESGRVAEEDGDLAAALGLYREAGATGEMVRVIVHRAPALLGGGAAPTLLRWIALLPREVVEATPWLLLSRGAARALVAPPEALPDLERAFRSFMASGDAAGAHAVWAAAVRATAFAAQDDHRPLDRWLEELARMREAFPDRPAPQLEAAVVSGALGAFLVRRPADPAMDAWMERGLAIALAPGDPRARLEVGAQLVHAYAFAGRNLRLARTVVEAARPLVSDASCGGFEAITWTVAEIAYAMFSGDAPEALAGVGRGMALADRHGLPHWNATFLAMRLLSELALDRLDRAEGALSQLARCARGAPRLPRLAHHSGACVLMTRRGDHRAAVEQGRIAVALAEEAGSVITALLAKTALAIALERIGTPAIEDALRAARAARVPVCEHALLLATASIALGRGEARRAEAALADGFAVEERTGCRPSYWLSRAELAELCAFALERGIAPAAALATIRDYRLEPGPRARGLPAWPWEVRVDALDRFAVQIGGAAPPERKAQRKPLELLRLLVASGERGASADRLAEALWPDADGDLALHALETTIYRLRRLLGHPAAVVHRGGRAALDPGRAFVDAWAFESLARSAEDRRAGGDGETASRLARAALALYRGDLLPDDDHLPGIPSARERLRDRAARLAPLLRA